MVESGLTRVPGCARASEAFDPAVMIWLPKAGQDGQGMLGALILEHLEHSVSPFS